MKIVDYSSFGLFYVLKLKGYVNLSCISVFHLSIRCEIEFWSFLVKNIPRARGMPSWKAAIEFKASRLVCFDSISTQICSRLLAYILLVDSSLRFAPMPQRPCAGLSPKAAFGYPIPRARGMVWWAAVLFWSPWLGHFHPQVGLGQSRLRWLNVSCVSVSFKFISVSVYFHLSMSCLSYHQMS